jgi:ribose transport system permease protein
VIGGVYIAGGRCHHVGAVAGAISLVALVGVLMASNMPEYGRSITYGVIILVLLLLYGRDEAEEQLYLHFDVMRNLCLF